MEYIKGQSLSRLLETEESLPFERAIEIALHVLDALAFARTKHICHRDIKPDNILIGVDGRVKLTDFGIAESLGTCSVVIGAGTSAYMAPEVYAPTPQMDYQSDVWSVGVVLYEMLTGQRPYKPADGSGHAAGRRYRGVGRVLVARLVVESYLLKQQGRVIVTLGTSTDKRFYLALGFDKQPDTERSYALFEAEAKELLQSVLYAPQSL